MGHHDEYIRKSNLVGLAYDNWYRLLGNNYQKAFWKFISPERHKDDRVVYMYKFNAEEIDRLNLLAGPYHVAIIKAHRAREAKRSGLE